MPDIAEFQDPDDLDNRYVGKIIVYVEGVGDKNVWEQVAGSQLSHLLEFKLPDQEGSGSQKVLNEVKKRRATNDKIFGLLDGEEAARFGEAEKLINCTDLFFQLQIGDCEGILFLGAHELENILIGHSDFVDFVENYVDINMIGSKDKEEIESHLADEAYRFYVAGLIKYVWIELNSQGQVPNIYDVSDFWSDDSLEEVQQIVKERIIKEFDDRGIAFNQRFNEIEQCAKHRLDSIEKSGGNKRLEFIRLADGKTLLARLRRHWNIPRPNNGILAQRVCQSEYSEKFSHELRLLTSA